MWVQGANHDSKALADRKMNSIQENETEKVRKIRRLFVLSWTSDKEKSYVLRNQTLLYSTTELQRLVTLVTSFLKDYTIL